MSSISRSFAQKLPGVRTYLTDSNIGTPSFTYPKNQASVSDVLPLGIVPPRIQGGKLYTRLGKNVNVYENNVKRFVFANIKAVDGTNLGEDANNDAYIMSWSVFRGTSEVSKFYLTG